MLACVMLYVKRNPAMPAIPQPSAGKQPKCKKSVAALAQKKAEEILFGQDGAERALTRGRSRRRASRRKRWSGYRARVE